MIPTTKSSLGGLLILCLSMVAGCDNHNHPSTQTYPEPNSQGAQLLLQKCSVCHGAPLPSSHVAKIWPSVLDRMQMRMSSKGEQALQPQELGVLLDYLQRNAGAAEK